jgi:hypothetical protein
MVIEVFTFRREKGRRRAVRERTGSVFMWRWRSASLSIHSGQDAIQSRVFSSIFYFFLIADPYLDPDPGF